MWAPSSPSESWSCRDILPRILPSVSRSLVLSEIGNFTGEVKGVLLYPRTPTSEARSFVDIVSERIKLQTEWATI